MSDTKALIAEARAGADRAWEIGHDSTSRIVRRLADALEAASVERAVVEAQALEQAADDLEDADFKRDGAMLAFGGTRFVYVEDWLRARAVEIRDGRQ